jgi:hypothetical protein
MYERNYLVACLKMFFIVDVGPTSSNFHRADRIVENSSFCV